jgi:hypothetical protein
VEVIGSLLLCTKTPRAESVHFTLEARKTILDRLLTIQAETGLTLISEDEVRRIREMWTADTILEAQKHLQLQEQVRRRAK